ncbi:hypothetical protein [Candidatus Chromulinivorax destructor]|uniref:Uncharacterized protein n=1 Tax=Candidatus Chromulinivorax destructor TaxID=2066483 RepID=A0A345ZCH8_9BACT|nr:hypothetical protein [Candidatus Chromulinivorax destructor]AXK60995.1 hypothetical protein C0J27_04660 [Candidatus Chromulinivorax destructor]
MKKQLYLIAVITASLNTLTAFDTRTVFDPSNRDSQYMFLEKMYITNVYTQRNNIWTHLKTIIPATCALAAYVNYCGICSEQLAQELMAEHPIKKPKVQSNFASICLVFAGLCTATCAHQIAYNFIDVYVAHNAVCDFVKNWKINQIYTPHEFHDFFNALAIKMENEGEHAITSQAHEIVEIMQFMVMRYFATRYQGAMALQAMNNMNETKLMLDIMTSSMSISKTLGA